MKYLYSTVDLEAAIEAVYTDLQGHCFPSQVSNLVERLVHCFDTDERHATQTVIDLLDELGDDFSQIPYDYQDLINTCRPDQHLAQVHYHRREQTLEVVYVPRQPPDPLLQIKASLQDDLDNGAYVPERLRSAYSAILES